MEDQQIVMLYWERDPQAIELSRQKYGGYCFSVAHNLLASREDAEECVNDTWLHAWNEMPPHRPSILRMFLAKITRCISFNRFKANTAQKRGSGQLPLVLDELAECIADENSVEDTIIAAELGESIRQFVRRLPEREGDIFVRRYFFTESIAEIAQSYAMTTNYTMVMLNRTRNKLKNHLVKEGYL